MLSVDQAFCESLYLFGVLIWLGAAYSLDSIKMKILVGFHKENLILKY